MPNTFGDTSQSFSLVDPRCVREQRDRFRRDAVPELCLANSYYSLSGRWPDCGWVLLDRASYNKLNHYSTNLQLKIQDYVNPTITVSNLSIIQARCVTRGLASDVNAIYLIQLTNNEGVLYNQWFQYPTLSQYNVRAPAYDTKFCDWSMNGGTTWTWDTMLGHLWGQAPLQLGTYPHLPVTPAGTPENWIFMGVPLWEAITRVLNHLGLTVTGSYPSFGIAVNGAADTAFAALLAKYGTATSPNYCLEDDMEYIDGGSGRVPGAVVVCFHRRNAVYGTEECVRYDSLNWQGTTTYTITVAAPSTFSQAAGNAYLWSSFTIRYDQNGNALGADVSIANTIAQDLTTKFYNRIFDGTAGNMRQVYAGLIPFTTGSLVDGVRWYNTGYSYGAEEADSRYCGWRTEIVRGYVWPEATFPVAPMGMADSF